MLSNSDFANLIKSGADFTRDNNNSNNNKQRFDLKQVRQWDKQNKQLERRRSNQKINVLGGENDDEEDNGGGDRGHGSSHGKSSKKLFLPPGYRDRAEERRKGISTDNSSQLDELATTMDAEQTKFLGGDVEHTHLVKGLDYALLQKMREQLKKQKQEEEGQGGKEEDDDDESDDERGSDSDDDYNHDKKKAGISLTKAEVENDHMDKQIDEETMEILTPLGRRLHHLLIANKVHQPLSDSIPAGAIVGVSTSSGVDDKPATKEGFVVLQSGQQPVGRLKQSTKLSKDSLTQMYHKVGRAGQVLARIQYEFYLSMDGPDVPVALSRAAKEVESNQDYVSYAMPKSLMTQLSACYEGGKLRRRSRKPQQQQHQTAADLSGIGGSPAVTSTSTVVAGRSSGSLETAMVIKVSDSLYDGILEDAALDGKYDPSASSSAVVGSVPSALTGSVKGIFSNASFRPHTMSAQSDNSRTLSHAEPGGRNPLLSLAKEEAIKGDASILQPVKNLLAAQARNKREQAPVATTNSKSSKAQGNVVYRDVFASSKEKVVEVKAEEVLYGGKQHGDVFGLSGTYDIFPENAGYDDFMDDSDGEGGAGGPRKRPKLNSGGKSKTK